MVDRYVRPCFTEENQICKCPTVGEMIALQKLLWQDILVLGCAKIESADGYN